MAALLVFQITLGPSAPPNKVIDLSNYSEHETKFGDKKTQKVQIDNSTAIGGVYEKLTQKVQIDEKPTIIEAPINVVKKDEPKKKREEPKKVVEKPKPVVPKPSAPKPGSSFSQTVEAHIDSIEATLSGLSHEMGSASSQWF